MGCGVSTITPCGLPLLHPALWKSGPRGPVVEPSAEVRTSGRKLVLGLDRGAVCHRGGSTGGPSRPRCVEALGIGDGVRSNCRPALDGVPVSIGGNYPDLSHPLVPKLRIDRGFADTAEPRFAVRDRGLGQGAGSALHQHLALRKGSSHLIGHRSAGDGDETRDPARSRRSTPPQRRRVPESTDEDRTEVLGVVECVLRDHPRQQLSDVVAVSLSAAQFRRERPEGVRGGESVNLLPCHPGRPECCDPPVALGFRGDCEVLGRGAGQTMTSAPAQP